MRVALINSIMPIKGSGDGISEYNYNMYRQLSRSNEVKAVYAIEKAVKNDVLGIAKVNATLSRTAESAAKEGYDIYHIVNQEVGFAARNIKGVSDKANVVTTIHDISRLVPGLHRGILQHAFNLVVRESVRIASEKSDFVMFDSTQTMNDAKKKFDFGQSKVVGLGIREELLSPLRKKNISKMFRVGYVGSFAYNKNVIFALKAASHARDIEFNIYGIGNEYESLRKYVASKGLKNTTLMGFAPEGRMLSIYDSFDAFVFPSMYEGFGLPILEAQARGLPVVISKYGRIAEEVRKYCFKAEDEEHMASILQDLKENGYGKKRRKLATKYARSFTWEKCAAEALKIYDKLV